MINYKSDVDFEPIFIIGNPRSGTTLLATLLDRHSRIAVPSETQMFRKVLPCGIRPCCNFGNHEYLANKFLSYYRISDLRLDRGELLTQFYKYKPDYKTLFRLALEQYARNQNKVRVGEKSPVHIYYVPLIYKWYPKAKVIAIVRDGRDVVRSLMKVPWSHKNFKRHCAEWVYCSDLLKKYKHKYDSSIKIVKYEDLVASPAETLEEITKYLGEAMESGQLQADRISNVVAEWENSWKSKSVSGLDKSRIGAWRGAVTIMESYYMHKIMYNELNYWGYIKKGDMPGKVCNHPRLYLNCLGYSKILYRIIRSMRELIKVAACLSGIMQFETEQRGK